MKILLLTGILFSSLIALADSSESTPRTRAALMMACDPVLASKHIALMSLVLETVMLDPDFAAEYNEAHEAYVQMKTCDDLKVSHQAYIAIAAQYGNRSVESYWLTLEGKKNLLQAANYLKSVTED